MGNDKDPMWSIPNPDAFVVCRYKSDVPAGISWIQRLLQNEQFYERTVTLFLNEFYPAIKSNLSKLIQKYEKNIAVAFDINRVRWQNELVSGSIQEETTQLVNYVNNHMEFLYSAWVERVPYCQVRFRGLQCDQYMAVVAGETLQSMPEIQDVETAVFLGWYYLGTDEPFDITKPITEDVQIYAKWQDTMTNDISQLMKLLPLGVIAVIGVGLAWVAFKRMRKSG